MIKPDGVQRGLVGEILKRFEQKGFKLVAMKFMHVSFKTYLLYCQFNIVLYRIMLSLAPSFKTFFSLVVNEFS